MEENKDFAVPFKLTPRVVGHPSEESLARRAMMTSVVDAGDHESRAAAARLSKEVLRAQTLAELPEGSFGSDVEKTAAASRIVELMTGEKDYDGTLWNGGKPFKTGADYLASVKETIRRGTAAGTDRELQEWLAMSDAEKDAKIDADTGVLSRMGDFAGYVGQFYGEALRGVKPLSSAEYANAPDDVKEASDALSSQMAGDMADDERERYERSVGAFRAVTWPRLQRRFEYEAKLRRKNALVYLPTMIAALGSEDAKKLAGELAQNPSGLPENWTARLKALPTRDIETLGQIRGMTRERVEGGFLNWLGDVGIGVVNGGRGLLSGLGLQEAKALALLSGMDEGEFNERLRRKHALWNAYAGWSSPVSQLSDEHGALANFTIGLASAVPFIASMHLKGLGFAACAGEMMSEADARAAAEGIDTTDPAYVARNALAGGLYAYMLKAVSPKFFGASATGAAEEMALRTAFLKGAMTGFAKLDTLKVMSQRTAAGALMMALQQGISAVNEDLSLGGDAWRDATQRFTETFVSSIPDMLAFSAHGVLEGHKRASGGWRGLFTAEGRSARSQSLAAALENTLAVKGMVKADGQIGRSMDRLRMRQVDAVVGEYLRGGDGALRRMGLKADQIAEVREFVREDLKRFGAAQELKTELRRLEAETDAESLEEIGEDAPLEERNAAARRYRELVESQSRGIDALSESLADREGAVKDVEAARNIWARGRGVGSGKDVDAGAAALEAAGFTPDDAKRLSAAFGAERRAVYSPAASEALRAVYTLSTRGRVEATAALADMFGGRVRTADGRTFLDIPLPNGGTGVIAVEPRDFSQGFYGRAGDNLATDVELRTEGRVTAESWRGMSDAERRETVRREGLSVEGDFQLVSPDDPSLSVSASDAGRLLGRIALDPSADPGAAFHEVMHGFLRFGQESGFFTEADVKWLRETYGEPRRGGELCDEEAGAEGFRRYMALRLAGAAAKEGEATPWRKMYALVRRLAHMRERNAAVDRIATNAEEALYDQILAGRYAHVEDLKFSAPAAPKAEPEATPAPEESAPPAAPAATTAASSATSSPGPLPSSLFTALTPTGGRTVKGHYEIVPLAQLLHSNKAGYPMELQQRDRKANKGEEATREDHVANFEPGYLLADPKTDSGAMIVARRPGPDGEPQLVVVSGNGRTMVLEELANRHLYDRYRNRMKEWAKENGVENAVADADNPVLVRVLDDLGGATLKEIADLSNKNAIQQMNEEETARADADLVRSLDLARLYVPNMDGSANMAGGANDAFFREFVRAIGDTSLLNSDGSFTEALRLRARRALLAIACGQGERGRDTVKKLVEDAPGLDRQKEAAAAVSPHVAATESRPEYAIGPDVSRAFADYMDYRENRDTGRKWGSLDEYLRQGDMLDQRSEIAESVMRLLDAPNGAALLAETARLYAEAARAEQDGLFGSARTSAEIWRDAAKAVDAKSAERRFSLAVRTARDYSWAALSAKEDMKLAKIDPEKFKNYKTDSERVSDAHRSVIEAGGEKVGGNYYIRMDGERVLVGADGIKHRGRKPNLANDFVFPVLGEVLKNAVRVNELEPRANVAHDKNITDTFVYLGAMSYGPEVLPVRIQVEHRGNERRIDRIDVLRSLNTKIGTVAALGGLAPASLVPNISIANLIRIAQPLHPQIFSRDVAAALGSAYRGGEIGARYSISGIFTGSAADYANRSRKGGEDDGPSLTHIGSGEGSQVYGWGLYGSTVRGVAEVYASHASAEKGIELYRNGKPFHLKGDMSARALAEDIFARFDGDVPRALERLQHDKESYEKAWRDNRKNKSWKAEAQRHAEAIKYLKDHGAEYSVKRSPEQVYEQTFFTNREPGDESHLLKWFEPIDDAARDAYRKAARDLGVKLVKRTLPSGKKYETVIMRDGSESPIRMFDGGEYQGELYKMLADATSPKEASEALARAGIDGVKYPVDSYGGKGVKDGDKVGWNYVAFSDEHIRVDHKWTDGQMRFSVVSLGGRDVAVAETEPLTTREAQDEEKVREVLLPIVGQEFEQKGETKLVKIDGNFPDYFWNSNTSQNLRRLDKLWRAKVSAMPILSDILKTTTLGPAEAAKHLKKEPSFKDRAVFYRCSTEFGIKRHDGVAVYPCDLLVMEMADNGQRYVYDIVRMKKPTLTAMADLSSEALSQLYERHLTGESASTVPEGTPQIVANPAAEIKRDPESFSRRSIARRLEDGGEKEREGALVSFVAERALRHGPKPHAIRTLARLGLELGLKSVDVKRIVREGEALADRVRGTIIEEAAKNGDAASAMAMLEREREIDSAVTGAAEWGGRLTRQGEGKIKSLLDREVEKLVRSFNAATLADVERDTGIDIAEEILANAPEKFDPKGSRPADGKAKGAETGEEGSAPGAPSPEDAVLSDYEIARRQRVRKEAEERVAKLIETAKARTEAARKRREEYERLREERRRKAEQAAIAAGRDAEAQADFDALEGAEGSVSGAAAPEAVDLSTFADFKTPEEFAAFFRVWAEDRYKKEHGTTTIGQHEQRRLFPEFYRKAAVRELQDLADKLLPPKGARATVNRWLGEIQPGVKPDTLERISADVFAFINKNAIRESRTKLISRFRSGLKAYAAGAKFDDLKMDADRRVTGFVEEMARYIRRVCDLSILSVNGEPSAMDRERERLQAILDRREKVYDDEGKNPAEAPLEDMETRRARTMLELLERYGAMRRYMPGQIEDLAADAKRWLDDEAAKLEAAWREARETEEAIRGALAGAIVGPNGQRYKPAEGAKGWAERLFDSMNGMIRLRLQHLVRFSDSTTQQKAKEAINRVVVMLGDGEVAFARNLQDDRAEFHKALAQIFAGEGGRVDRRALADWLNRMTEPIPRELSARLSTQGYADSMTYGQMLQLLVSLEQLSYRENVAHNGRDGQAALIRSFETVGPDGRRERVLTEKDIQFVEWLRSFYEAKRKKLSAVTRRMVGLDIDSPDPLYCPVKMYMGDRARGMHVDTTAAWDPIGSVFSRRIRNTRDFDESASILGQFFDRSAAAAKLVAWGERGSIIRGVFTDPAVQQSIRLAFGGGELTKILKQLEETFNGGESVKKTPGEIAAADKAMNWTTYLSLGYNPLSAMKQTTSFTVWANALPGGFRDLWRYMTDVDMATIRHIRESDEFRVRYGNEVGSGQDVATKGLFENPSENPVAAFFRKTSMGLLRKGDFLPGGWIAQGLFRDLYNRHLKEGMDADAADRLAMTETFNMLEETQQSGRTYNTSALAREHGRLGRLLVQFATSPLQQLQYETQAMRELWDLKRFAPAVPDADYEKRLSDARGRLLRAAVINHVLLPAALHAVTDLYRLAMGQDPEWSKEGWHWTLLRDLVAGQFSRVFFLGAISSVTTDVLITGKPVRDVPALIPAEGVVKLLGNVTLTARDIATLNYEQIQKDLHRLLKSTSITRTPYDVIRRVTGNSDADDKRRRKSR